MSMDEFGRVMFVIYNVEGGASLRSCRMDM